MVKSQKRQTGAPLLELTACYSERPRTITIEVPRHLLGSWGQIATYHILQNGSQPATAAGPRGISTILRQYECHTGGVSIRIIGSSPNPVNGDHRPGVVMSGVNPNKVGDITKLAAAIMRICCVPGVSVKLTSQTVRTQPAKLPAGTKPPVPDAYRRRPNRGAAGKHTSGRASSRR